MNRFVTMFLILLLTLPMAGCDLIGDILEFGFWLVVIGIGLIVVLIGWVARRFRGGARGPRGPGQP